MESRNDEGNRTDSPAAEPPPLRSVHTNTFAQILAQLKISIAVTTYQAGKLVLLRSEVRDGKPLVNTHFRNFQKPMGFAWEPGRFALGTNAEIWEFHDMPPVARKLDASAFPLPCDAVFLPRNCHMTGDIQVHEMAWVPTRKQREPSTANLSELWYVNTRFSCLATRSDLYSFEPRWQPPFITSLAPEDRCHLNGIATREYDIRYATALGETDTPAGWRENKRAGGILMDVRSNDILTRGLSMPHSPRWRDGKLWILESGNGGVGIIDLKDGTYREICRLPGFTRGFDFAGPYAFVGLSQVRESAVFSGIAIAETPQEQRCCGVWAIDIRTGRIAGFVKFTDAVQEIFAVQVLSGISCPEVLNEGEKQIAESYELSDKVLQNVPANLRQLAVDASNASTSDAVKDASSNPG
jgi:uncharacterized protein (TIGR03032 family)